MRGSTAVQQGGDTVVRCPERQQRQRCAEFDGRRRSAGRGGARFAGTAAYTRHQGKNDGGGRNPAVEHLEHDHAPSGRRYQSTESATAMATSFSQSLARRHNDVRSRCNGRLLAGRRGRRGPRRIPLRLERRDCRTVPHVRSHRIAYPLVRRPRQCRPTGMMQASAVADSTLGRVHQRDIQCCAWRRFACTRWKADSTTDNATAAASKWVAAQRAGAPIADHYRRRACVGVNGRTGRGTCPRPTPGWPARLAGPNPRSCACDRSRTAWSACCTCNR